MNPKNLLWIGGPQGSGKSWALQALCKAAEASWICEYRKLGKLNQMILDPGLGEHCDLLICIDEVPRLARQDIADLAGRYPQYRFVAASEIVDE